MATNRSTPRIRLVPLTSTDHVVIEREDAPRGSSPGKFYCRTCGMEAPDAAMFINDDCGRQPVKTGRDGSGGDSGR